MIRCRGQRFRRPTRLSFDALSLTAVYGKRGVGETSLMRQMQQLALGNYSLFSPPPSGQFSLFIEPAHHYPVEGIGLVDIAEVAGVWDLLVAGTRHQFGEAEHRFFRAVWILGTADRQCRDLKRRELRREVVIHDRRRAAEHPRRCRLCDGVADLLPTTRFATLGRVADRKSVV